MAGVLPEVKRYMEKDGDGWGKNERGRQVTLDELKALTDQDREDFREMLAEVGITAS